MCATIVTSTAERKRFVGQLCASCQRNVRGWNEQIAWAEQMVEAQAWLVEVQGDDLWAASPPQPASVSLLDLVSGTVRRSGAPQPGDAPALAEVLQQAQHPVLSWDGAGLGALRDWVQATTGQFLLFGRLERLCEHMRYVYQGERVVAYWQRPFVGKPDEDLAWCCQALGVEEASNRLETMRRLVLHQARQPRLTLGTGEGQNHARTA